MAFITARMTVMKHIKFLILSSVSMFLFASVAFVADVFAANPHFTPMSLLPQSFASASDFKVAGIYWLPDYLKGNVSRGSEDKGGGDIDGNCEKNYGMHTPSNIDNRYICSKYNYNVTSSLKCHVNCRCKDEYQYTSSNCSGDYTTAGTSCEGKYNQCVCKSEFKYNSSNCSGEYEVSGTSCGGNYNGCTIRPECTVSSMSCTYGCAGYNSCDRCTSCKSNPDCDVTDKSCDYGCASTNSCGKCTSCKDNPDCSATAVSCDYGCASTNSCGICTSCSGNPDCDVTDKSCDYGCAATNSCGKCTSCKSCTPSANETGCTDGTESCSDGCGGTRLCCKGHTHSYSCPSGYQASSCSSSQVQTGTTSKVCSCGAASGTCYSCRAKTCSDGGYVSSCPSGQTGTTVSYAGLTCYTNCKASCSLPDCKDRITTKPANSSFTTSSCTDCSGTHTINTGWRCNSGYTEQNGNSCVLPAPSCSDDGYYGGTSCSNWSGYSYQQCAQEYGHMGSSCNSSGALDRCSQQCVGTSNAAACYGSCAGSCDVNSWRRCCHQCSGDLT